MSRWNRKYCNDQCGFQQAQHVGCTPIRYGTDCVECGKLKYYTKARIKDGYCSKSCVTKAQKRMDRHKRRARLGTVTERFTLREIAERDGWRCHICGKRVIDKPWSGSETDATIDHLIPVAANGNHTRVNVALAHNRCNWERSTGGEVQLRLVG